ncbi:MAG: hypothetical protein HF962_03435 [Sulfurovum sp.]|nr:hypothetical protein [Sulfurovum sp.]
MKKKLLCIQSHYGKPPKLFQKAKKRDDTIVIRQSQLSSRDITDATALITTMHLDQIGMMEFSKELEVFLERGGRWFFNGHMMRPLVYDLKNYIYIDEGGDRESLRLTELSDHFVFKDISRDAFLERKGVAGFYGRGHNPMPKGAVAITGVGRKKAPIDWVCKFGTEGEFFSHSGNDIWGAIGKGEMQNRLLENIITWVTKEES